MSSSSDDEDDPVVQEVDMYLAKGLAEKLLLFQYPVRPSNSTYDFTPHLAARIKPIQQKVELELGIDTNSSTYCYARGEQIAYAVDADAQQGLNEKKHFPDNVMDRQLLSSMRATEDSSKYAAAIYCDGAIHITPIKGIFQMHPCFTYFDKAEENQKKAGSTNDDDSQKEEELKDAKPVQLRFGKGQNQKKKEQGMKQEAEEKWVETQFYQPHDRRAIMERNLLLCHQDDFESPEFTVTSRDYLKILSPSEQHGAESPADLPHGVLSLLKLKGMSLTDQIKALLITAKVLQFTQLCALLGGGMDTSAVLTGLTQYAMLVQGCWVVKSTILYPHGSKSHVSGLDAEKLWPSRDYVMFCFNRKRVLSRKEVASNTRLPTEELREVLEQIGKQRPAQGWEFMLNTDNEFLKGHTEDCLNQLSLWKQKYKEISESLHLSEEFSDSDWNESNFPGLFPGANRKPMPSRRRRTSQSAGSDSNEKNKPKARRRTKSQSSQDGLSSPVAVKVEELSPLRNTSTSENPSSDSKLNINILDIQGLPNEIISPKSSQKYSKSSPKKIAKKTQKVTLNSEVKSTTKNNLNKIIVDDSNQDHIKNIYTEVNTKEIYMKPTFNNQKCMNPMDIDNNLTEKQINDNPIQRKIDYSPAQQQFDHTPSQKLINDTSMQRQINYNLLQQQIDRTLAQKQINDAPVQNQINDTLAQKQIEDIFLAQKQIEVAQKQIDYTLAQRQIEDTLAQQQIDETLAQKRIDDTLVQKQIEDILAQKQNVKIAENYNEIKTVDTKEFTGKRKRKKRVASIISDSDDDSAAGFTANNNKLSEENADIFIGDAGKSVNEIEVDVNKDEYINNNDNSEEIFVPPMAAGGRTVRDDKERPPSDIFIKELKRFIREAIQAGCLSLMELKEVLNMRQQEAGNILCTGVSDELLVKCAKASGAFEIPLKWSEPNNIPIERKRLFLYRCLGDNTDTYRNVVIDLFTESQSLRRKDIFESFTKALGEVPSNHIYTKVISEFCQNHHGQWYLNGTYTSIQKYSNS